MLRDLPLDIIQEADLVALVDDGVSEDQYIEFKTTTYGTNDEAKRELLADVCAFANAQGGDLLLGIEALKGRATKVAGLTGLDVDAEILRLESIIRDGIEPRLAAIQVGAIRLGAGDPIIIIRIPGSAIAPHRLAVGRGGRFVRRDSAGKYDMDIQQLREAFSGADLLIERFSRLHETTVAAARGKDMPFSIGTLPAAVLSLTPLNHFRQVRDVELDEFKAQQPYLRRPAGSSWMTTLEGTLVHGMPGPEAPEVVEGYAHSHRSGRIEAAWRIGGPREASAGMELLLVFADHFERGLIDQAGTATERLRGVGISGPWIVAVTVLNIRGYDLQNDLFHGTTSYREEARLPQLRLDEISQETLKPIFGAYWRLFGHKRTSHRKLE